MRRGHRGECPFIMHHACAHASWLCLPTDTHIIIICIKITYSKMNMLGCCGNFSHWQLVMFLYYTPIIGSVLKNQPLQSLHTNTMSNRNHNCYNNSFAVTRQRLFLLQECCYHSEYANYYNVGRFLQPHIFILCIHPHHTATHYLSASG